MKLNKNNRHGFTLLEIMLVVAIISLLLGSAIYAFKDQFGSAKIAKARGDIQTLKIALTSYQARNGFLPSTEQGLKALQYRPETSPRPKQWAKAFENDSALTDPWGNDYQYAQPGVRNPDGYDISSMGPDGKAGTEDDISN